MTRCIICESDFLKELDDDIENGVSGADIARRYNVTPMNVSRHKQHRARNNLEDVRTILNTAVDKEKIEITNTADYIRMLEYEERQKREHYGDCSQCEFRENAPTYVLQKLLSEEGGDMEIKAIISGIDGKRYTSEEYLGEDITMSEQEYQKYRKQYKIDGV